MLFAPIDNAVTVFTRYHITVLGLLIGAFLVVTLFKYGGGSDSQQPGARPGASADTLTEANEFWDIYQEATEARIDGRYERAVDLYREALARRSDHRDARFYLGESLLQSGQLVDAQRQWEMLLDKDPESARVRAQLAGLFLCSNEATQHDLPRAKRHFRAVKRIHGAYEAEPHVRLAQILTVQDSVERIAETLDVLSGREEIPADVAFLEGYQAWQAGRSRQATVSLARSRRILAADTSDARSDFRVPPASRNSVCRGLTEWRDTLMDRPPGQIQTDSVYTRFSATMARAERSP